MADRAEIIQFVKDRLGFTPNPETRFWWDTGMAGLDAWTFMGEFADRYGVDMEGADQAFDYGDSDVPLADALDRLWKRITFRPVPKVNHFTIDHLVEVANRKKWFDPVRSFR
ncbi:MAG: DUF1493 family protein [Flavobacteriales bacterium]|nr:DUF1493 family protein [Flavobacteriales bacterium]MBK9287189.1 DUF1493 family protein [Flavobacteriales bacterium]MBL0034253.1 DUF1493 family protein [Flavobacteriales bacterium]